MIYVDGLNVYFANMGKSLASGSNCSSLGDMIIPKSIDKTIFLYSTDPSELYSLIKTCKAKILSGPDGLSDNHL